MSAVALTSPRIHTCSPSPADLLSLGTTSPHCHDHLSARKEAQVIYIPVIFCINVFYWLLKYLRGFWLESTVWEIVFGALFAAIHFGLYLQILDHAETRSSRDKNLVGGHWLDVLAVIAVIQLGAAFSAKLYWLLLLLPVWGGWSLYQTIMGKQGIVGSMKGSNANVMPSQAAAPTNRKQRRAEQKNQKR